MRSLHNTAENMGRIAGAVAVTYFLYYPIIYFAYNWFIEAVGYAEYRIPGFWVGMVGYFLFNVVKNTIKGFFK